MIVYSNLELKRSFTIPHIRRICKKKICLIASEEIPFTYVDKYELKCIDKSTITVDEEEFFVYIFEPTPDKDKIKKIEKPKN